MRILFLTGSLALGGAERQITVMARSMAQLGHHVGVAVMYPGGDLESELSNIKIFSLQKQGRWDVAGFLSALVRTIRRFRPDIVQTFLTTPNIAGALLRPLLGRARLVWGIRNSNMDLSQYDAFNRHCAKIEAFVSPMSDLAIANSQAGLDAHFKRGLRPKRFEVVRNGIDTERFRPSLEERKRLRRLWQVPEEARLCLAVGRLDPMKDHTTLLRSMRYWPANIVLAIVGTGSERAQSQLETEIDQHDVSDRVRLIRPMTDIESAYPVADAFVHPSAFGEGFSNALAEAMSSGLQVAATDVGDARQIVGDCGRIVPPKNPEALGNAVAEIFSVTYQGGDSRQRIISNYSIATMVENTLQLYAQLICLDERGATSTVANEA